MWRTHAWTPLPRVLPSRQRWQKTPKTLFLFILVSLSGLEQIIPFIITTKSLLFLRVLDTATSLKGSDLLVSASGFFLNVDKLKQVRWRRDCQSSGRVEGRI